MKNVTLPIVSFLLAPALFAVAPYPSVLSVKYKEQMLPVVHVYHTDPVVVVDGKERTIRTAPTYLVGSAPGFAENFVEAPAGALGGPFRMSFMGGGGGPYRTMSYIEVPLTARKTIKRGFAVVVIYANPDTTKELREKYSGPGVSDSFLTGASIIVHEIPELPAGKAIKVKFAEGGPVALLSTNYFIQIFDDAGHEVRSADVEQAWRFYAMRDRARLANGVTKYLEKFKGADHDAVPAMMPKPIFAPGASMPTGEVVVTLTVEADGSVSEVAAAGVKDEGVRQSLVDALGGWLFLPRLKAGEPVTTKVSFPLKF